MKTSAIRNMTDHEKLESLEYFCNITRSKYNLSYRFQDICEITRQCLYETIAINDYNSKIDDPTGNVPNVHAALSHELLLEYMDIVKSNKALNAETYNERLKEFYRWFKRLIRALDLQTKKSRAR